ncbi:hypothetical protein QJS04_geneDACA007079 [Acorus gramineus]|uniref:Trichome birefringence-like N-terminal domain-containing protein n=1 Tax=Acorus gramineus TaxID=55184 RepID=A0AAV9BQA1_ACOGR|nr:hypothetical protein QJS04_geneDACA007079 [Acorus gramineus]
MERQRSFTLKPTRFLVLSFTVSSSMLFCFFFSSWVFHETTPLKSHFHFSPVETKVENLRGVDEISSFTVVKNVDLGDTHLRKNGGGGGVLGETLFRGTVKDDILEGTHLRRVTNSSEGDLDLEGTHLGESVGSSGQALDSVRETQNPVFGDTHLRDSVDPPEWAVDSVIEAGDRIIEDNDDSSDEEDEEFTVEESDESETSSEQDWAVKDENISSSVGTPTSSGGTIQTVGTEKCDIFNGRWVFDENYPLYSNSTCPYIDEGFSCESNGRLDRNYMKWRWQPHHCDIPRYIIHLIHLFLAWFSKLYREM